MQKILILLAALCSLALPAAAQRSKLKRVDFSYHNIQAPLNMSRGAWQFGLCADYTNSKDSIKWGRWYSYSIKGAQTIGYSASAGYFVRDKFLVGVALHQYFPIRIEPLSTNISYLALNASLGLLSRLYFPFHSKENASLYLEGQYGFATTLSRYEGYSVSAQGVKDAIPSSVEETKSFGFMGYFGAGMLFNCKKQYAIDCALRYQFAELSGIVTQQYPKDNNPARVIPVSNQSNGLGIRLGVQYFLFNYSNKR